MWPPIHLNWSALPLDLLQCSRFNFLSIIIFWFITIVIYSCYAFFRNLEPILGAMYNIWWINWWLMTHLLYLSYLVLTAFHCNALAPCSTEIFSGASRKSQGVHCFDAEVPPKFHGQSSSAWWFQTGLLWLPFHIWDVIPTPLTNSYFSRCL